MILIWLPGGVSQTDTWDPKRHTPYEKGMRGDQLLGTCPLIDTAADRTVHVAISNAFGFGGHNVAVAFTTAYATGGST